MKYQLTLISVLISLTAFSQTAIEWYNKGNEKLNAQDYAGSIKDYDRALVLDSKFTDAYYNRGTSKLYTKNFSGAADDFTKAIDLKPDFINAYTNRANARINLNNYKGALEDFDAVIKIDQTIAIVYLMRGQIKLNMDDRNGGCADLKKAKTLGESRADSYIKQFCEGMEGKESLKLDWPPSENWKIANDQENDQQHLVELIHSNETLEKWTEIGNMLALKNVTVPIDKAMTLMSDQIKEKAPEAKLTLIEKDDKAAHPWIIFMVESPRFKNDNNPESQMWYIVQGKQALYTNFRAIKKATIPAELKTKWIQFFKSGKIVIE